MCERALLCKNKQNIPIQLRPETFELRGDAPLEMICLWSFTRP